MNRIALLAAGCAALALAGCDHPDAGRQRAERALKVVSKLDCPESQGDLRRVSAAADGQSCVYSAKGAEVTLKIVPLAGGDVRAALTPVEIELRALLPAKVAAAGATATIDGDGDSDGEEVSIRLPGVSIEANDAGARVRVAGGVSIDADDDRQEVRVMHNAGEGGDDSDRHHRRDDGVQATFILASDDAASAWRVVGYEARGPKGGPLVMATVKARTREADGHDLFDDMKTLIRHNVGGGRRHGVITVD